MATLHVRNVPDAVYRALRQRAASRAVSIGAETVRLLEQGLRLDHADLRVLYRDVARARERPTKTRSGAALIRADRDAR